MCDVTVGSLFVGGDEGRDTFPSATKFPHRNNFNVTSKFTLRDPSMVVEDQCNNKVSSYFTPKLFYKCTITSMMPCGVLEGRWRLVFFVLVTCGLCSAALPDCAPVNQLTRVPFSNSTDSLERTVRLAVIAPSEAQHEQSLSRILPSIELAVARVSHPSEGTLPGWDIQVDYRDSKCSSTYGPLAAFEFYINRSAGDAVLWYTRKYR